MEALNKLSIGLFDPGMTHIHRIGLAGLYMTLKKVTKNGRFQELHCMMERDRVTVTWKGNGAKSFDQLLKAAFGITKTQPTGLIDFAAHRGLAIGDLQRIEVSRAILGSFLQHNKQNKIPKGTPTRSLNLALGDDQVVVEYKPFVKPYAHSESAKAMFQSRGKLKEAVTIKGWLFPGATERHVALTGSTDIEEPVEKFLCLLFAPVAALYYRLYHRGPDGKADDRRGTAVCFPHVTNIETYVRCYERYLGSPAERLFADGLGDAGLSALLALKAQESLDQLGLTGCTILTMGTVGWSKQQRSRTGVAVLENIQEDLMDLFDLACRCFPNRIWLKNASQKSNESPKKHFPVTSLARGLIAENIAVGKEWFLGFSQLMRSQDQAKRLSYFEKGGLKEMIDKGAWRHEADKQFIEAIHVAVRNRYGALAAQATKRGETIRFDREFERMRTGLMRAKNAETLRAELADLFARGGLNKTLQENWPKLLPFFTGSDWQRARDLALLGLASYTGKGAEQIASSVEQLEKQGERS
jgi:CRISPR-associated protein Cas8a1/Csx13